MKWGIIQGELIYTQNIKNKFLMAMGKLPYLGYVSYAHLYKN